ncbi:fd881106-be12-482f-a766-05a7941ab296 [Thermothielavioides terrestris]|uniref:Fd881106-be12-482f-a766-05a7941ab296 n=1 Tax=Thermothielavioides terrestris TaxID=2587410 RepID=A0A3S5CW42_9PEZI|nr:fd881106-be12-482f-a766-05a7941ab296 [Thermothielavioides terrestris]
MVSETSTPLSPRAPVNANKPLPSPPPPGSEQTRDPPARPVLKLARIMATLTDSEIEKLFSGAPQFFARSEGHYTGAPHPSVAFPWDEELEIRDLTDHTQIEDKAWGSVTAWPHITRDVNSDRSAAQRASEQKRRAHFLPRCRERPNMLSMAGLEKGSVGYQAALELAVADALQEEQWGFEGLAGRLPAIVEQRRKMLTSKDGLRHVDETLIMEQLIKNGQRYNEKHLRERRVSSELYNELFLQILHAPTKVLDHRDPYSLAVQILALVKILAAPNMWIDFSQVEWRVRLGQLLWENPVEDDSGKDGPSNEIADSASDIHEERYWLLLQILLACELLIRLDTITEGEEAGMESIRPAEIHRFDKDANKSVKWSLILARVWLENIEVVKTEAAEQTNSEEKPSGWLATLTKRMSLTRDHGSHGHHNRGPVYAIRGKHVQRQVDGLAHFASRLRWPGADPYVLKISDNCRSVVEGTPLSTPLASPSTRGESRHSFDFGAPKTETSPRRTSSRPKKISAALHPSGWLSKSYVSGLMLPGETVCHLLMATLLENDPEALSRLGPMANFCGGFVYSGKSFWSTACIGLGDGWVDVGAEKTAEDASQVDKKARLWGKKAIEKESNVLGDADPSSVLPADFIIPFENIYRDKTPPVINIELKTLSLMASVDSVHISPTEDYGATSVSDASRPSPIHTYAAAVTFTVTDVESGEAKDYTYKLAKDIIFVTAHPCVPSQHVKIMKSPSSPTIRQVDLSGNNVAGKTASVVGHPLHKYYTYTALHLSELLTKQDFSLESLLGSYSSASHRPSLTPAPNSSTAKVLVVDCITGFQPQPQEHEIPLSPILSRTGSNASAAPSPAVPPPGGEEGSVAGAGGGDRLAGALESASKKMHSESRRRQFGSDMEMLARAFCAEKGWNALISRRRRGY